MHLTDIRKTLIELLEDDSINLSSNHIKALQESVLLIIEEENYRRKVQWLMGDIRRNT